MIKTLQSTTFLSAILISVSISASALPTGGQVVGGQATITTGKDNVTINQTSNRADINWRTFGSDFNDSIVFNQPNSSAITINRVTANVPTVLAGKLTANGRVVIINDAGITFAKGSVTNVGALIATTATNVLDKDYLGNFEFKDTKKSIVNNGVIDADQVVLVAPVVMNNGIIQGKDIHLTGGNSFRYDTGQGKVFYDVPAAQLAATRVINTGIITGSGATVNIMTKDTKTLAQSVINMDGIVDVNKFSQSNDQGLGIGGRINLNGGVVALTKDAILTADNTHLGNNQGLVMGGQISINAASSYTDVKGSIISASGSSANGNDQGGFIDITAPKAKFNGIYSAHGYKAASPNSNKTHAEGVVHLTGTTDATLGKTAIAETLGSNPYDLTGSVVYTDGKVVQKGDLIANGIVYDRD